MSLADLQTLLWQLITAPEGARATLESDDPRAPTWSRALHETIRSDAKLENVDRLEVYANAYFYRIHDCLRTDFAALSKLLGEDHFHDLVTSYLAVLPPEHPSLRYAGERLADFLAEHPSAASFRAHWPCAPDLARLEWAHVDAFDARDAVPLTRSDLETLSPEGWAALPLEADPSLQLLQLDWPVQAVRRAFDREEPPPDLERRSTYLCTYRKAERVCTRAVDAAEAEALESVKAGTRFGELCERLSERCDEAEAAQQAARWLGRWVEAGLLARAER